jgi:hypothetical protein
VTRATTYLHGTSPRTTVDDVEIVGKLPLLHADRADSEIALENAWSGGELTPATSGGDDYRIAAVDDNAEFVGVMLSVYMRGWLDAVDAAAARTALGLGTAATQNTGTSGANVPLLDGNNTHSGTNLFQKDTDANHLTETKNVNAGTASAAGFATTSDGGTTLRWLSHALARTVARCGQTLGGWNEILSFLGNGLLISTNGAAPIKIGTNNTPAATIDTSQVFTFVNSPVAPTPTAGTNNTQLATTAFVQTAVGSAGLLKRSIAAAETVTIEADYSATIVGPLSIAATGTLSVAAGAALEIR